MSPEPNAHPVAAAPTELRELRERIDGLDAQLIRILAERFDQTDRVGCVKAEAGLPAHDPGREAEHIASLRAQAAALGLDPDLTERIMRAVMGEVVEKHRDRARRLWG